MLRYHLLEHREYLPFTTNDGYDLIALKRRECHLLVSLFHRRTLPPSSFDGSIATEGAGMERVSVLLSKDKTDQVYERRGDGDPLISGITYHSASADAHTAFIALKGTRSDGHLYIEQAIANGSRCVIHSQDVEPRHSGVTYLQCPNPQILSAQIACALHGPYPSHIIGITGTDGKSSTAVFLYRFLTAAGNQVRTPFHHQYR